MAADLSKVGVKHLSLIVISVLHLLKETKYDEFTGKKEKGAPDLNNEDFFPTLSAAVKIEQDNIKLKKYFFFCWS